MGSVKKFRAWLKPRWDGDYDANKMYYDIQNSYDRMGHVTIGTKQKGEIKLVTVLDPMESFAQWLDEDAAIVEQFTGLLDRNGKEIYEGDIVRVSGEIALNDDICVDPIAEVVWVDSAAGFGEKFTVKKAPMMPIGLYNYEVIGNIHENPELLEDK